MAAILVAEGVVAVTTARRREGRHTWRDRRPARRRPVATWEIKSAGGAAPTLAVSPTARRANGLRLGDFTGTIESRVSAGQDDKKPAT